MKKIFNLLLLLFSIILSQAQTPQALSIDKPIVIDGIEYGYYIKNESTKEASGKDMSRFEVMIYAKNIAPCLKMFLFERRTAFSDVAVAKEALARFDCTNATGQRLTSKSGTISAKPFYTIARTEVKDCATSKIKIEEVRAQIGFGLKVNEVSSSMLVIIVPFGEKPNMQLVTLNYTTNL